jgi:hypothetical protein
MSVLLILIANDLPFYDNSLGDLEIISIQEIKAEDAKKITDLIDSDGEINLELTENSVSSYIKYVSISDPVEIETIQKVFGFEYNNSKINLFSFIIENFNYLTAIRLLEYLDSDDEAVKSYYKKVKEYHLAKDDDSIFELLEEIKNLQVTANQ